MHALQAAPHHPLSPAASHQAARPRPLVDPDALRDALPVVASLVPFGMILGVTIANATVVPVWVGLLASPLFLSGTAQLAVISLLETGAGLLAAVATGVVISARFSMYGAALEPRFRDQPRWFRLLGVHVIIDQTYALASARPELEGVDLRRYWCSIGGVLAIGWNAAIGAGAVLGPLVPADSALGFAAPAVFVGLLVPRLATRDGRTAATIAAGVAVLAAPLPNGLGLLLAAVCGLVPSLLRGEAAA